MLVVIAGTGTDVGKTWVACRLAALLRDDGWVVSARKPAQSFAAEESNSTDAHRLAEATGESPETVCPPHRWYARPLAPPMAADALGAERFTCDDLVAEHRRRRANPGADIELVELAGGVLSPLAHPVAPGAPDDGVAFAEAVAGDDPDDVVVVLVADAGLGTIDQVRRATRCLTLSTVVFLNRFTPGDDVHRMNAAFLADVDGLEVVTDPAKLAAHVAARHRTYCSHCGRVGCSGACAGALDPLRYCPRCGRRLAVRITPTSVAAQCRRHGPVAA